MTGLFDDLRYAFRALFKNRGFAAVAILSLALAIGINTTIFTFVNAIFLRPLPVRDPASLVTVFTLDPRVPGDLPCSYPNFRDYRDRNQSFSAMLASLAVLGSLTTGDAPRRLLFELVSGDYFQVLGIKPALGRGFVPEEDTTAGASPIAVISDGLWKREFGGTPQIIGQTVEANGQPLRIVGVAPSEFRGLNPLNPADLWIPMGMYPRMNPGASFLEQRRALFFGVVARLKPQISIQRAEAEILSLSQALDREFPRENAGRRAKLVPLTESTINTNTRRLMETSGTVLMIVAGLVLLIACGNVANLLLTRAAGRNKEIAVRLALGAGRWRLVRQLLTESIGLALAGGALGLVLAASTRHLLWNLRPPNLTNAVFPIELDGTVLAFTLAVSLLTGILFGLAPALRATHPDLATDLKERTSQSAARPGRLPVRSLLLVAQVCLCVVSLVGAGLFIRSLQNAEQMDTGFQTDRLATVAFNLADLRFGAAQARVFEQRLIEQAAAVPGVASVALSKDPVFRVAVARTVAVDDDADAGEGRVTLISPVSPDYLRTMGIALVRGRDFNALDTPDGPRVAIVNEAAAARYWPGQDPVGRRIRYSGDNKQLLVVGVARNANYLAVGENPQALIYTPLLQDFGAQGTLVVRANGDPELVLPTLTRLVQSMQPRLRLQARTVRTIIAGTLWLQKLSAGLLGMFAILGLLLAGVGIYGVISYSVHQRVREIGVRMALGATPASVRSMILREVLFVVAAGVLGGLAVALAASRGVRSLLFITGAVDALTFLVVPALLFLVATLACWLPVMRATHVDPATALREE